MRQSADEVQNIGININGRNINNLRYADDIVLIGTSASELQQLLDKVEEESRKAKLEINTRKTKVMTTTSEQLNIQCRGMRLDQVSRFKYLGSIIEQTGGSSGEIRARLGAARSAFKSLDFLWRDRALPRNIKWKVVQTMVWPVALYGAETWTLKVADIAKLHAFEMYCFRRLLGVSWRDHRTNESVLQELGVQREFVQTVRKRKLQYFGHVVRAQNLSTDILEGRVHGRRPRGRPRRRWTDDIKEWTRRSMAECTTMARRRNEWRRLVHDSRIPDPQR